MSTLQVRLQDLATRIATECKAVRTLLNANAADLSALDTTAKSSLVAAINELKGLIDNVDLSALIDDAATDTDTTWSSTKIADAISDALAALTAGAPTALDTLDELAAALGDDANFAATVTTALGNRVRVDTAAQGLTTQQKADARTNIAALSTVELGNPDTDLVATFEAGLT